MKKSELLDKIGELQARHNRLLKANLDRRTARETECLKAAQSLTNNGHALMIVDGVIVPVFVSTVGVAWNQLWEVKIEGYIQPRTD